jgi:AraC-like DNA-binding protein
MTRLLFTEYEAFAEAVQDVSVTLRLCAMEAPNWTLQYADVGPVRIQQGCEGGGTVAEGATRSDGWTLFRQSYPVHANGQLMNTDEVFAAPPGSEFCVASKPSHEWITVFIPTSLLFPSTPELPFAACARPQVLKPATHVSRRFTSLVRRFLSTAHSEPQLWDHPVAVDAFQDDLVSAAQALFATRNHSENRHFVRWHRLTGYTLELAMSRPDRSLSVRELARQAGVPERTLRTAFSKSFGLSPQEYLRIERLHQARRLLRTSCEDQTTVTQIAFAFGFWDVGRFAGAYRALFGERPSETLRKPVRA